MPLNEEQVQKVRLVLASAGWNDVMRPVYANRAHQAIKTLCLSRPERAGEFKDVDDETLRAIIRECEWMVNVWNNEIHVQEYNRKRDELDASGEPATPPANPEG